MEYKVHYNGQETNDFDTLAGWFMELKKENERLKEANEQHRDDYIRLKLGYDEFKQRNRDLEEENKNLKTERSKTKEVLKRYCGDSVDTPISTMVGLIIDDYFYQKAETECQVKALQKAEKTIDKLNKELVEYTDKVEELEEELKKDEKIIDDLNTDTVGYANKVADQREQIKELEKKVEKLENQKLIHVQGDNVIEHAAEITDLKRAISALKKGLEELRIMNDEYSCVAKDAVNAGYWAAGRIRNLEEENNKLKDALEFCQKEASSAREHAHNVEVNAERIRKGLD